jgi:hypothetical protein
MEKLKVHDELRTRKINSQKVDALTRGAITACATAAGEGDGTDSLEA